jgi:hypothetical protein
MKYIKLFLAVQPVALVAYAHHLGGRGATVLPDGAAQQPPQMPAYAA